MGKGIDLLVGKWLFEGSGSKVSEEGEEGIL